MARKRYYLKSIIMLLTLLGTGWGFVWASGNSGFQQLSPGVAHEIEFSDNSAVDWDENGEYRFTTVSVVTLTNFSHMLTRIGLKDDTNLIEISREDQSDQREEAAIAIDNSKEFAWAVANSVAGIETQRDLQGIFINQVFAGSAADDADLFAGDIIETVNGESVSDLQILKEKVQEFETLDLEIRRADELVKMTLNPIVNTSGEKELGVVISPALLLEEPAFNIESGTTGGPSAGLMFTLVYLDAITKGSLHLDSVITGTGTVDINGNVGPIGGAHLKVKAAEKTEGIVFFVPELNYQDATNTKTTITVVEVNNIMDAVDWLCNNGANSELCTKVDS